MGGHEVAWRVLIMMIFTGRWRPGTGADQYMEIQKGQAGSRRANEDRAGGMAVEDDQDTWGS
jgi:hypothetical protein